MKIRKLAKATGCGVFAEYTWSTSLQPFADRVVIYGWNGAGKTTLTSILRELETKRSLFPEHDWEIVSDTATIRRSSLAPTAPTPPIRVFNSDFVAESVFAPDELAPVLYVGKGTREKQKRLEECRALLEANRERDSELASAVEDSVRQLDHFRADQARLVKESLRSSGPNPYNNYDKAAYRARAEALRAMSSLPGQLGKAERDALRLAKDVQAVPTLPLVQEPPALTNDLGRRVANALAGQLVSAAIERLAEDPEVGRWVETGLELHEGRHSVVCLFCGRDLAQDTIVSLQRHFDGAFRAAVANIESLLGEVQSVRTRAEGVELPVSAQLGPSLRGPYESEVATFLRARADFVGRLRTIEALLLAKRDAPFKPLELGDECQAPFGVNVQVINALIRQHNDQQRDLSASVAQARASLADDLILQQWTRLTHLEGLIRDTTGALEETRAEREPLQKEADALETEIVEHLTPASELTAELATFLGREDITFAPSGTGYTISRQGQPARGLSEGEKSAIALLYFLKTLSDRSFNRAEGVVVIDDPVSSLDSNALFCALGYLQAQTQDIGQVFFLTHNFSFFRELRKWLNPRSGPPAIPCALYFLKCVGPCGTRRAALEPLDNLLRDYDSEYQYLFKLVWEASQATDTDLTRLFHYPNLARRLLEAFLAFRMPDMSHVGLRHRLEQTKLDAAKRERMLRFLDFQSHGDGVDIPEEDLSSLAETPDVLRDVLAFMSREDGRHFKRMCNLVGPPGGGQ